MFSIVWKPVCQKHGGYNFLFDLGNYNVNVIGYFFYFVDSKTMLKEINTLANKQSLEKCHIKSYILGHKDSIFFRKNG